MKLIFKIIFFMVFFNISALMVTAMHIFPAGTTLYSDAIYDTNDPNHMPSAEEMFTKLIENAVLPGTGIIGAIGFAGLITLLFLTTGAIAVITKDSKIIAAMFIGTIFYMMYCNSRTFFDNISKNTGVYGEYFLLMIGTGILIIFLITVLDYLTAQSNEE